MRRSRFDSGVFRARVQPSRRKALGELPGSLRLARRCSTKRKRLMTACQPRGLPRTWTPARRWGQGWCARSPLATVTAHGQRSEVCRARRHRVHRQRAYCYRRRWPTGRCRRSNPARRCVSRDGPHLAEHSVKHPVKHCETHRQSVTKRRQPPLPGAPTDPLPTARPHARYPVRPPGYCRGHEHCRVRRVGYGSMDFVRIGRCGVAAFGRSLRLLGIVADAHRPQ